MNTTQLTDLIRTLPRITTLQERAKLAQPLLDAAFEMANKQDYDLLNACLELDAILERDARVKQEQEQRRDHKINRAFNDFLIPITYGAPRAAILEPIPRSLPEFIRIAEQIFGAIYSSELATITDIEHQNILRKQCAAYRHVMTNPDEKKIRGSKSHLHYVRKKYVTERLKSPSEDTPSERSLRLMLSKLEKLYDLK